MRQLATRALILLVLVVLTACGKDAVVSPAIEKVQYHKGPRPQLQEPADPTSTEALYAAWYDKVAVAPTKMTNELLDKLDQLTDADLKAGKHLDREHIPYPNAFTAMELHAQLEDCDSFRQQTPEVVSWLAKKTQAKKKDSLLDSALADMNLILSNEQDSDDLKRLLGVDELQCGPRSMLLTACCIRRSPEFTETPFEISIVGGYVFDRELRPNGERHAWVLLGDEEIDASFPRGSSFVGDIKLAETKFTVDPKALSLEPQIGFFYFPW